MSVRTTTTMILVVENQDNEMTTSQSLYHQVNDWFVNRKRAFERLMFMHHETKLALKLQSKMTDEDVVEFMLTFRVAKTIQAGKK